MITQSSSEQSICFVVPDRSTPRPCSPRTARGISAARLERRYIDDIHASAAHQHRRCRGQRNARHAGAGRARLHQPWPRKGINVIAIAQGASEANISLVVTDSRCGHGGAVRAIHDIFELHLPTEERSHSWQPTL
jgi:aspartokinase/homoserine dehydrogenase 1